MTAQSEGAENTVEASYASTDGPRAISSQPAMASGSTGSCTIAAWLLWSIECFVLARWSPAVLERRTGKPKGKLKKMGKLGQIQQEPHIPY
jgi:hypothetical protein